VLFDSTCRAELETGPGSGPDPDFFKIPVSKLSRTMCHLANFDKYKREGLRYTGLAIHKPAPYESEGGVFFFKYNNNKRERF
jgi:hypothetical protein